MKPVAPMIFTVVDIAKCLPNDYSHSAAMAVTVAPYLVQ